MITALKERVAALPPRLRDVCERLFFIDIVTGYADPPATMEEWIERQFGSVADIRAQRVAKITNRLTLEGAIINPLRARRPMGASGGEDALEQRISEALAGRDHFRAPLRDTTADLFGRIQGAHCMTASNVAKCDGWHGLALFNEPHPLRFTHAQLHDYLDVALRWMAAAHARDSSAIYPIIFWHCLPKGSASQMHGHMQLALGRGMHYARVELWRRTAAAYRTEFGVNYFDDLFAVHEALGLSVPSTPGARAFAHLTPLRQREIVILSPPTFPQTQTGTIRLSSHEVESLSQTLYTLLRSLIDGQGVRAFNVAIALPPLTATHEDWRDVPVITRIGDRGDPLSPMSDIGALELYAMGCITIDPFDVAMRLAARG
jgi:hypothetical protein